MFPLWSIGCCWFYQKVVHTFFLYSSLLLVITLSTIPVILSRKFLISKIFSTLVYCRSVNNNPIKNCPILFPNIILSIFLIFIVEKYFYHFSNTNLIIKKYIYCFFIYLKESYIFFYYQTVKKRDKNIKKKYILPYSALFYFLSFFECQKIFNISRKNKK